jgi:hypothetical protein
VPPPPVAADDSIWELCKHKLGVVGGALGEESAEEGELRAAVFMLAEHKLPWLAGVAAPGQLGCLASRQSIKWSACAHNICSL